MKIISHKQRADGKTEYRVLANKDELIVGIDKDAHYKLGEPMHDEVMSGHILADIELTHWCSIEQKWI